MTTDEKIDQMHAAVMEIRLQNARIVPAVEKLESAVHGNAGANGLSVRVDRLEVSEGKRDRGFWVLLTAALGGLGAGISAWMRGHQ